MFAWVVRRSRGPHDRGLSDSGFEPRCLVNRRCNNAWAWDQTPEDSRLGVIGMAGSIPLRLQDTKQAAWADGKRDIFLVIYKQPGAELRELVGHDPVRPRVSSQKPNL